MNRIFKVVFNKTKGMFVVTGENAKTHSKSKQLKAVLTSVMIASAIGITGNAMAGNSIIAMDESNNISLENNFDGNKIIAIDGASVAVTGEQINIDGSGMYVAASMSSFNKMNDATLPVTNVEIGGVNTQSVTIQSTASSEGYGYGVMVQRYGKGLATAPRMNITAKNISITAIGDSNDDVRAIHVGSNSENQPENNVSKLTIKGENISIASKDTTGNLTGLGLSVMSQGQVYIDGNVKIEAKDAIYTRGNAKTNINIDGKHSTVLNGDIGFGTPYIPGNPHNSGRLIEANVNLNLTGEESSWTGRSYQELGDGNISTDLDSGSDIYGDVTGFNLTIADGAAWNATGDSFVNTLNMQNGGLINNTENHTVNIGEYSAKGDNNTISGGTYNITNTNLQNSALTLNDATINTDTLKTDTTTINLSKNAAIKTNTLSGNANINLATVANGDDTFQAGNVTANNAENAKLNVNYTGITADNINNAQKAMQNLSSHIQATDANVTNHVAEGDVAGALTWTSINDAITNVKEQKNSTLSALTNLAANNFLVFRAQTNDLDKRMGDLRTMPNSDGAWARVIAGQSQYKNIHNTYQTLQAGIDHRIGNFIVGGTASYTDGDGSLRHGDSDDKNYTFGLYGSWLNNDGQFIDVIVKRQHLQSDYDLRSDNGLKTKGSYHTEGTSISAEYGWRIGINNTNYYLEPQAEFTYGHLDSVTYKTNRGVKINQDAIKTAVGRVGLAAGWVSPDKTSSAYIKASVLNDWEGDARTKASKDGISRKYHEDMGGTWGEFAIGGTYNLNKNLSFYGEAETTSGNPVRTTYQISAGMRYSF